MHAWCILYNMSHCDFFKYDHKGLRNTSCMDLPFKFFLFVLNSGLCETLIDTKKFIHISCALAHINMIYIIWFYIKKKVWKIKQVLIWYSSYLRITFSMIPRPMVPCLDYDTTDILKQHHIKTTEKEHN